MVFANQDGNPVGRKRCAVESYESGVAGDSELPAVVTTLFGPHRTKGLTAQPHHQPTGAPAPEVEPRQLREPIPAGVNDNRSAGRQPREPTPARVDDNSPISRQPREPTLESGHLDTLKSPRQLRQERLALRASKTIASATVEVQQGSRAQVSHGDEPLQARVSQLRTFGTHRSTEATACRQPYIREQRPEAPSPCRLI